MLLTFSKPEFEDLIKTGVKIHTIRTDETRRWKPGMTIHLWRGNPRNVKSGPYQFGEHVCDGVQEIHIRRRLTGALEVRVDGRYLSEAQVQDLATADGLTLDQFRDWFVPVAGPREYRGRIIHWTDKRY